MRKTILAIGRPWACLLHPVIPGIRSARLFRSQEVFPHWREIVDQAPLLDGLHAMLHAGWHDEGVADLQPFGPPVYGDVEDAFRNIAGLDMGMGVQPCLLYTSPSPRD